MPVFTPFPTTVLFYALIAVCWLAVYHYRPPVREGERLARAVGATIVAPLLAGLPALIVVALVGGELHW